MFGRYQHPGLRVALMHPAEGESKQDACKSVHTFCKSLALVQQGPDMLPPFPALPMAKKRFISFFLILASSGLMLVMQMQ